MIRNRTKGFVIAEKARFARSIFAKGTGLMFRKKPDYGLVFEFSREKMIPLTMMFMLCSIDVLFLDKDRKVVEIARLKPFRDYMPKKKAMFVVELPVGAIGKTRVGDLIEF
ncbi:MAG: DUF192 domain-containing protein [archaeon]